MTTDTDPTSYDVAGAARRIRANMELCEEHARRGDNEAVRMYFEGMARDLGWALDVIGSQS
jgi:hypothetical protein